MNQSDDFRHKRTRGIFSSSICLRRRNSVSNRTRLALIWSYIFSTAKADTDPNVRSMPTGPSNLAVYLRDILPKFGGEKKLFHVNFLFSPHKEDKLLASETNGRGRAPCQIVENQVQIVQYLAVYTVKVVVQLERTRVRFQSAHV